EHLAVRSAQTLVACASARRQKTQTSRRLPRRERGEVRRANTSSRRRRFQRTDKPAIAGISGSLLPAIQASAATASAPDQTVSRTSGQRYGAGNPRRS